MKEDNSNPPKIFQSFLKKLIDKEISNSVIEALEIQYTENVRQKGKLSAEFIYLFQFITFLISHIIFNEQWRFGMFGNYIKIAFRNIKRNKVYSSILLLVLR